MISRQPRWWVFRTDGSLDEQSWYLPRPADANPIVGGDRFTPYYQTVPHIHVENGKLAGLHGHGPYRFVREQMLWLVQNQERLGDLRDGTPLRELVEHAPFDERFFRVSR